jgi:hypothetical protein
MPTARGGSLGSPCWGRLMSPLGHVQQAVLAERRDPIGPRMASVLWIYDAVFRSGLSPTQG